MRLTPQPLTPTDLPWVVELAARRRARLVPFAPRFWKPALAQIVDESVYRTTDYHEGVVNEAPLTA